MRAVLRLLVLMTLCLATPAVGQSEGVAASRYVSPQLAAVERKAIAAFGPFRVLDDRTVALVDVTDGRSPGQFEAMLAAFPLVTMVEFVEAPGTEDDLASFRIARLIRERGIATRAPAGGSVRSGAVELFLAGVRREIDAESEFAVHGWIDEAGRGAQDYPADAPEHRRYLDYYAEVGMGPQEARAFYAMTNSVPFEEALWLTGSEMRGWIERAAPPQPQLARLDFKPVLQ